MQLKNSAMRELCNIFVHDSRSVSNIICEMLSNKHSMHTQLAMDHSGFSIDEMQQKNYKNTTHHNIPPHLFFYRDLLSSALFSFILCTHKVSSYWTEPNHMRFHHKVKAVI
jgi:hypothetical protein